MTASCFSVELTRQTPATCSNIALHNLYPGMIDLVVSGPNRKSNVHHHLRSYMRADDQTDETRRPLSRFHPALLALLSLLHCLCLSPDHRLGLRITPNTFPA